MLVPTARGLSMTSRRHVLATWCGAALLAVCLAACSVPGSGRSDESPAARTGERVAPGPSPALTPPPAITPSTEPRSQPSTEGCSSVVTAPASLQDAIDAVTDHATPYVLCLEGTFAGGGAPSDPQRPGIGPYYGGVVIKDRSRFTLRGLPGSRIVGVANDSRYPALGAPVQEQGAADKGNLIKVVDSTDIVLEWLDIDGRVPDPSGGEPKRTLNRLVWFQNTDHSALRYSRVQYGGGECVRLKSNSQFNEVHHNVVADCGHYQFKVQSQERLRKNGEAIYIGTDPAQIADTQINRQRYWGLDPNLVTDRSSHNLVHHNVLRPGPAGADWGNECVDLKEDWPRSQSTLPGDVARGEPGHNVVSDNDCAGQFDPDSGAFDSRGPNNVFEHNRVSGTVQGAAIRIGAKDKAVGEAGTVRWRATDNVVRLNRLESYGFDTALKVFKDQPLAEVCGNVDGDGSTDFDGEFSNASKAAKNRSRCQADDAPAGPRGPVGIPPSS